MYVCMYIPTSIYDPIIERASHVVSQSYMLDECVFAQ